MGFFDLFRPKWKHPDPAVRLAAVERLDDQAVLVVVATADADEDVRKAAVERLDDQVVLVEIATTDADEDVRKAAVERLDDQEVLVEIAATDADDEVRIAAVKRVAHNSKANLRDAAAEIEATTRRVKSLFIEARAERNAQSEGGDLPPRNRHRRGE